MFLLYLRLGIGLSIYIFCSDGNCKSSMYCHFVLFSVYYEQIKWFGLVCYWRAMYRTLYWTDSSDKSPAIYRSSLLNPARVPLVTSNLEWPSALGIWICFQKSLRLLAKSEMPIIFIYFRNIFVTKSYNVKDRNGPRKSQRQSDESIAINVAALTMDVSWSFTYVSGHRLG